MRHGGRFRTGIDIERLRQIGANGAAQLSQRLLHAQCSGLLVALRIEQLCVATNEFVTRGFTGFHPHGHATADLLDERHVFARVARIGATVTGRVTELLATPGQSVKAGDILARLHSTELGAAQLAYQKAAAQRDLQARALERAKLLLAADVIGSAELQKRQSELAMADAEVRAAVDQLRVMGVSPGTLAKKRTDGMSSISPVVASISGTVVERKVTRGQVVQPADELFTVADLSRVWVVGEVPENAAAGVRAGQAVEIDTGAGDRIVGKLIWVSDIVDPQTRTVTVRTEVDNVERTLKPSMLATLIIQSRPEERVVVPTSAVVREDNRDYVFVRASDTNYQLTPVKLGDESNGVRPVVSGVQAGQPIVVEGGFHLNNERKRAEMEGA